VVVPEVRLPLVEVVELDGGDVVVEVDIVEEIVEEIVVDPVEDEVVA